MRIRRSCFAGTSSSYRGIETRILDPETHRWADLGRNPPNYVILPAKKWIPGLKEF